MKNSWFKLVGLMLLASPVVFGQVKSKKSYLGIRAGYLHTSTNLTIQSGSPYQTLLGRVAPQNSYYGGVFYHHSVRSWLAYRVETNYQLKGFNSQDQNGTTLSAQRFHYIGVTPLIGITPVTNLSLFVGPEANLFLHASAGPNPDPIELGISGRISYRYQWIGLEVGYFNAFNQHLYLAPSATRFSFTNRTWQIGLLFVPTMLKEGNRSD